MSTAPVAELTRLAQVDSANVHTVDIFGFPQFLLDVVAQASGFNWKPRIQAGAAEAETVEYFPYYILEASIGPGWPKNAGPGPVVLPTSLTAWVNHIGSKGIEVIGRDFRKRFDLRQPA